MCWCLLILLKGFKTALEFCDTCTPSVRSKLFKYQSQVTLLSTGWILHLLITTTSPTVPCEDAACWCGGLEWGKSRITSSCDFSLSPVAVWPGLFMGTSALSWETVPDWLSTPLTLPPREEQTVCSCYEREAGAPKLIPLGPCEWFWDVGDNRTDLFLVMLSCRHWGCLIPCLASLRQEGKWCQSCSETQAEAQLLEMRFFFLLPLMWQLQTTGARLCVPVILWKRITLGCGRKDVHKATLLFVCKPQHVKGKWESCSRPCRVTHCGSSTISQKQEETVARQRGDISLLTPL